MTTIFDPIHGYVEITPLMQLIIDTPEFQRLRHLRQLGVTHHVFPSANHTRFEHSIGVSHLAKQMGKSLQRNQPELNINDRLIELWQIAGLIHDLGHGPFSHLYDDQVISHDDDEHEERGIAMFLKMIEQYGLPFEAHERILLIQMINPDDKHKHHWQNQIVANKINQLDVDKMDYIMRDAYHIGMKCEGEYSRLIENARVKSIITDQSHHQHQQQQHQHQQQQQQQHQHQQQYIAWPEKLQYEIFTLFATRYRLHKQVYSHPAVKAYEFLIVPILKHLVYKDAKPIPFVKLIDSIVYHPNTSDPEILRLVDNINRRQHPKLVEAIVLPYKNDDPGTQKTIEETVTRLKDKYLTINRTTKQLTTKQLTTNNNNNDNVSSSEEKEYLDNYVFVTTIIGFAGKSTPNPLENVYFYNNNKRETTTTGNCVTTSAEENALKKTHQNYAYTLDLHRCSFIIPKFCKEAIIRVYKKTN